MKKSKILYLFLSFFFIFIPLLGFRNNDFWDGVNVAYAFESKNYAAIDEYMVQGAYYLQYLIYKIFFIISEVFNFSYKYITCLFYAFVLYNLAYELEKFSKNILNLKGFFCILPGLLIIIFPIWSVLISSIFVSHVLFIYFVFLGSRLFFDKNLYFKILGILLLVLSYELKSNLLFSIILFFLYELRSNQFYDFKNFRGTIFIFILNFTVFFIFKTILAPSGLWEGHNEFINMLDWFNFKHLIWHSLNFFTFYIPLILSATVLYFFLKKKNLKSNFQINAYQKKELYIFLTLFVASAFSTLPYLSVLKSSRFITDYEYTPRCAFLLAPTLSLLFAYVFNFFNSKIKNLNILKINILLLILLFSSSSIFLYIHKYNFLKFRDNLVKELKLIKIDPGIVVLNGDGIPYPTMISKESNYVFWKAYNDTRWATHVLKDKIFNRHGKEIPLPKNFTNQSDEFLSNKGNTIHLAENFEFICLTKGEIKTDNYVGIINVFNNLLGLNKNEITIDIKSIDCKK